MEMKFFALKKFFCLLFFISESVGTLGTFFKVVGCYCFNPIKKVPILVGTIRYFLKELCNYQIFLVGIF